jgi:DNA-binding transcriptional MerR regulator/methylmalonyl-CoA mutase cobalamin-binding subunit
MPDTREGPFFNLKAVLQQTGLKPDTLRAWERRYGLPRPIRSGGGHRLYSQRDIGIVKWLVARQQEGLSIKCAAQMWRQLESEGQNPLQTPTPIAPPTAPAPVPRAAGEAITQLREEWIAACLAYDERKAEQALAQTFALYPPETVCLELLQKAIAQIGEGWYRGEVTVQQEHFCSALAVRRLEALVMAAPPPTRPGRVLVACPPQENHTIGLLLLAFLLRRRGWEVTYLGANVPLDRLETTVAATNPELAIVAAQQLHTAATLLEMAQALQREGVPLAYGGLIFNQLPTLREHIPGHFLGEHLESAPQLVGTLMAASCPLSTVEAVPEAYQQAGEHYRERQGLIEAQLGQALSPMGIAPNHLALTNREIALDIGAALTLGDVDYMDAEIEWVESLMRNHRMPTEALHGYLRAYYQAAKMQLDERGEPILAWLARLTDEKTEHEKEKV